MISFGTCPLHPEVSEAFILHTANPPAVVEAVAQSIQALDSTEPRRTPVPLVTNVITGVGYGGPPCNALTIPEYQYILPGRLMMALDNAGEQIYNDMQNLPDLVIDLYNSHESV